MTGNFKKAPILASVLVLVVLIGNGAMSFVNTANVSDTEEWVAHTHAVLGKIEETASSLRDAETAERGFVITGEERYLTPHQAAVAATRQHLAELKELTQDNLDQQRRLADFETTIGRKLAEMQLLVNLRTRNGFDAARSALESDKSRELTVALRTQVDQLAQEENRLMKERHDTAAVSLLAAHASNVIGVAAGLLMIGLAYVVMARDRTADLSRANAVLRDEVEQRKQAEAQVQVFAAELQRSNQELQVFAAVASHDLQEPLRKIQAFGDRLKTKAGPALDDAGRDYLERMQAAAARMATLITDLLTYSRVSTKGQAFVPVDLGQVAQEVLSDLESRLESTQGRVEIGPLPALEADPLQMRQLLQNLIGNALKFRRSDVAPVVTAEGRVLDDATCEITVRDNGIGFEEVYRDRIFGFFQRLHGRNEYEGSGMGLAICRRIVERHGGTIAAQATPGQGATFTITLPLTHSRETLASDQASQTDHHLDGRR